MICPKCKVFNDETYEFCTECGTTLSNIPKISSSESPTEIISSQDLQPTLLYSVAKTNKDEPKPTEVIPSDDLPTVFITPEKLPTQYYSPSKTDQIEPNPTVAVSADDMSSFSSSSQQSSAVPQYVPPESMETAVSPNFQLEDVKTETENKLPPKKKSKVFLIGGITLLVLLISSGVTVYFLAQPMQENKSYVLTDNLNQANNNTLQFDNQDKVLLMFGTDNNNFQKWQITPASGHQDFYRFVNRGLGEKESLEVIDDDRDSSVGMAQTLRDTGQRWTMTKVTGDYYRITNEWLGDSKSLSHRKQYYFFLRVRDSKNDNGQLWKKIPVQNGQGFYLVNKEYGDTLSLQALTKDEYKDKLVMKSGEYGNRHWNLNDVGNGFYTLTTVADGKSLDLNPGEKDRVKMAESGNSGGQKWKMTPVEGEYFRLTNESLGDGKSLEAVTFSKYGLGMVKSSDNDPGQLWKITRIP